MKNFVHLSDKERREFFQIAAEKKGVTEALIEKDFWVCLVLKTIFELKSLKNHILFKGGTSLSKVYELIDRFSEDIDLILDWRQLGVTDDEAWADRSATQQDKFNAKIDQIGCEYIKEIISPALQAGLQKISKDKISIEVDQHNIKIGYPSTFEKAYLLPYILLEIGPRAARIPSKVAEITPYVAQIFPNWFKEPIGEVVCIVSERTFWEKVTILHQVAHLKENKPVPPRYSRHYYDVYKILNSDTKHTALQNLDLLRQVVEFKNRFYRSPSARYDLAKIGSLKIIPPENSVKELKVDYTKMKEMLFGEIPSFEEIMESLQRFESELNSWARRKMAP